MNIPYDDEYVSFKMIIDECYKNVEISGIVRSPENYSSMQIIAANPAALITAYAGSGLPFGSIEDAFSGTKNVTYATRDGVFHAKFKYPNSYYTSDAWTKVKPSIFFNLIGTNPTGDGNVLVCVPMHDPFPLRTLNYRPGFYKGPIFDSYKEEVIPIGSAQSTMINIAAAKIKFDIAM
jgi:hypothetical protein